MKLRIAMLNRSPLDFVLIEVICFFLVHSGWISPHAEAVGDIRVLPYDLLNVCPFYCLVDSFA
jgi:hypothetical protein